MVVPTVVQTGQMMDPSKGYQLAYQTVVPTAVPTVVQSEQMTAAMKGHRWAYQTGHSRVVRTDLGRVHLMAERRGRVGAGLYKQHLCIKDRIL